MAHFVGGVEFLWLHFFFFFCHEQSKKRKNKNTQWTNGECKKEEIYFVQTAEHPV